MAHILKAEKEMNRRKQEEPRKIRAGMNIMRVVYKRIKNNESDRNLEDDLLIQHLNGVDIGDINHSCKIVSYILPHVAQDIRQSIITFLTNSLKQTTYLPTGKVLADSSTSRHRKRQFVAFLTVIPDSEELIRAIYFPFVLQKGGSGLMQTESICESLKMGTDNVIIQCDQYLGTSGDGHFQHCSVHTQVDGAFGVKRHHEYDPMHKAGRQDVHIRRDESFKWLSKITKVIGGAFKYMGLDKEFETFFDICTEIIENPNYPETKFYEFVYYNECRFANSTSRVYNVAYEMYSGMVEALETSIEKRRKKTDAKNQEMAHKASNIANVLHTVRSAARISGLADIYAVFAKAVEILQKVNYLPYERMDKYLKVINQLNVMVNCVKNHNLCPSTKDGVNCVWPRIHSQERDLREGKFKNKILAAECEEQNRTREGLRKSKKSKSENPVDEALNELQSLSKVLHQKLKDNVFNQEDQNFIEKIRSLTDTESLTKKCFATSIDTTYSDTVDDFINNAKELTPHGALIPVITLKEQYKLYLHKIYEINDGLEIVLSSKDIIARLLNSDNKLYVGIEKIMYVVTTGAVLTGIESIIESHISVFNDRFKKKTIDDERASNELMIKLNGPELSQCGKLLKRAVESSKNEWHFVRQEKNVRNWIVSKVIDRKLRQKSSLPFTV